MTTTAGATHRRTRIGLLQVCGAGVLWGTGGLVVTVLHSRDGLGAMTVSAWRMALAAVALVGFAVVTRRSGVVLATIRTHPVLAVVVGVGTALYQALYFGSVLLVGVSVSTVVSLGLAPVLTAAWEHAAARSRPSLREVAVLTAALTGLVLISATAGHGSPAPGGRPGLGIVLAVASGATYAATTLLGHTLAQRVDSVALTTCATAAGTLALLPWLGIALAAGEPVLTADPASLALLAYLGVATMALAYGLLYAGLRTTSGSAATVATLVEPLSAALLAALLLGERLTAPALLGGALILAAVVALQPTGQDRTAPAPTRPGPAQPDGAVGP
ncbi:MULTISPECIES: DMT family transporter [Micromonospora]|uniref:DMT family transporter n=1 Tax=Micromonospora TaxID=1873 RepID=UPI00098D1F04|nr:MULTISPECIES: EamA family transporter [unclassified Micromonospora]OON28885.1 EamA family transporter [Micromonospora sp. Rc5]